MKGHNVVDVLNTKHCAQLLTSLCAIEFLAMIVRHR